MSLRLAVQVLDDCPPEHFVRLGAGLLQAPPESPRLIVARIGERALLLGRHQRVASAIDEAALARAAIPPLRRIGGGRALLVEEGSLGVYLSLPRIDALLAAPIAADRLINRYVRGLNLGLSRLGAGQGVYYFGRDFISSEGKALGWVSQEGGAEGAALFEALVGDEAAISSPTSLSAYPPHGDPRAGGPPPVGLRALGVSRPLEEIAASIAEAYAGLHGCSLEWGSGSAPLGELPALREEEAGWEESGVADIPIGFVEALVRLEGERLDEVRIRGDFIAPTFVREAVEAGLRGVALDYAAIGTVIDEAFRRPGAAVLGLRSLRVWAEAVLAAAGRL